MNELNVLIDNEEDLTVATPANWQCDQTYSFCQSAFIPCVKKNLTFTPKPSTQEMPFINKDDDEILITEEEEKEKAPEEEKVKEEKPEEKVEIKIEEEKKEEPREEERKENSKEMSPIELIPVSKDDSDSLSHARKSGKSKSSKGIKKRYTGNFGSSKSIRTRKSTKSQKKIVNLEEISDFYEYTDNCLKIISKLQDSNQKASAAGADISESQYIYLPFANRIGLGHNKKRVAIFDLDETLIHSERNNIENTDKIIDVVLPNKVVKKVGINIRPHWKEALMKLKPKYFIIMYTASHQSYADAVVNFLDSEEKIFDYRLYRNNCTSVKVEGNLYYIKDLRIFKGVSLKDIVIIDNSVLSFAFHLDNGIPILPYYSGKNETELDDLSTLLLKIADCDNISERISQLIQLKNYAKKLFTPRISQN